MIHILWWTLMIVLMGRQVGDSVNRQNRDPGGKPNFVQIPSKWKWMFQRQKGGMYAEQNKMVKVSVIIYLLGYLFVILELILFFCSVIFETEIDLVTIADGLFIFYVFFDSIVLLLPNGFRYDYYMRKTYDYDWITYYKEELSGRTKRLCKIVSKIDKKTYEITLGRFGKRRYRANADMEVKIGEIMIKNDDFKEDKYCKESKDDFIEFVMEQIKSTEEDYYEIIDLLDVNCLNTQDIRLVILGAYLSSTWLD